MLADAAGGKGKEETEELSELETEE